MVEYTLDQRKFLVKRRLAEATLAMIQQEYAYWWPVNTILGRSQFK